MSKGFQELIDDLRDGRDVRQAQEGLYRLVRARLLEPLRAKVPRRARARLDAEDVLHEALLRAFASSSRARFETERQFLAWVYRIARNLMADQAKRRSADAVQFARGPSEGPGDPRPRESRIPGRDRGPESAFQRKEAIDRVLGGLPDVEADVIRRRWLAGQSFEEIASALRRTTKAVRGLYTRAWKRFQDLARKKEG